MLMNEFEPEKVFHFFFALSKIPHGSGNMKEIGAYCLNFAKERGLRSFCDTAGNVMIFKDGTKGYEQSEPVILQAHLDMVCEKRLSCSKDLEREAIDIISDGEYLRADGTTLGGDDGIGVAYILALLDDPGNIPHPPIEAVLTVDEETGLQGAHGLDASPLRGKRLINIDSEEEGVLTVSCAGAVRVVCGLPAEREPVPAGMCAKKLTVRGLLGGHSGIDIGKGRRNAAVVLGGCLDDLSRRLPVRLADMAAGGRLNVIPSSAEAVVCFEAAGAKAFEGFLAEFNAALRAACAETEPEALLTATDTPLPETCLTLKSSNTVIAALLLVPNGISAISPEIPFLVQTSSNLGSVSMAEEALELGFMLRSNTDCGKAETLQRLRCLVERLGGKVAESDDYPAWEYKHTSLLRDVMVHTYETMYGQRPKICALHAGLECGIFAEKIPGADMVSIGPNMQNVHTPEERLEIKSVQRCWEYLLQVLARLK